MIKYGRTYHLPLSPGATADDKVMRRVDGLMSGDLVVTEKMDGENTTIHAGGTHARSPDGRNHPSRDWVKAFAGRVMHRLGADERIVGENLYARHSIAYAELPSYFLGFAWITGGIVRSWDETLGRFDELGITAVPLLYRGVYEPELFERLAADLDLSRQEGFVARVATAFPEAEMPSCMGKYVRSDHVQSDVHWMNAPIVPNGLKTG